MIAFEDRWVWDFWLVHDGQRHHIYYLSAPRSLGDEQRRHRAAQIGHSSSTDLTHWTHHGTVLDLEPAVRSSRSRWTGSIVRHPDGRWLMFYTEARHLAPEPYLANIQTVAVATSTDLHHWEADSTSVSVADARWYETLGVSSWTEEAWRDPWVQPSSDGLGWDMLITARSTPQPEVPDDDAGVLAHAWSADLTTWQTRPPLSRPGSGFGHLEVPQLAVVEDQQFLLFSCGHDALSHARQLAGQAGGIWSVPAPTGAGDIDVARATSLLDERYYSGRTIHDSHLGPVLLAVVNRDEDGEFVGHISDPMPLVVDPAGHLSLSRAPAPASSHHPDEG